MVVVSHLFFFLRKYFRGRCDSGESHRPLSGTIYFPTAPCIYISCQSSCLVVATAPARIYCNRCLGSAATGLRESTGSSPACVIEAFPISVAEAFPICPASFAGTDIMPAAAAAIAVVIAAAASATTAAAVVIAAAAPIVVIIAATSAVVAAAAATANISTTTPTTATMTSTSTSKSKTTHISHLLFYWFVLYHMGRPDKV